METRKATIKRDDKSTHLVLQASKASFEVVLTDDNPNNVKSVFNELLKELKNGLFEFKLEDETQDLYFHICSEYITQLNKELVTIYNELISFKLIGT